MASQKLLLDLSALVDVRLGVLSRDWAEEIKELDIAGFMCREKDDFTAIGVSAKDYEYAIRRADLGTLKLSPVTGVVALIMEVLHQYRSHVSPASGELLEIDLNVWPFVLEDDIKEMYGLLLEHALGGVVKVTVVDVPFANITLDTLKRNYHTFIIYDWVRWAIAIQNSFRREQAPTVTVIVPKLLHGNEIPPVEEQDPEMRAAFHAAHPTAYMEFMLQDLVGLVHEDVGYFSIKV